MRTPAWIITGLLDSGKTTLINKLMEEVLHERNVLVIQFESGDETLRNDRQIQTLVFSKSRLEQFPMSITDRILEYLEQYNPDLMLVEWNGMEHFHKLEEMLLQFSAAPMVSVEKVIYMADETGLQHRIPDTGAAAFSQIAGSDCAYIRATKHLHGKTDASLLYNCNPDIRVFSERKWERFVREMFHFNAQPGHWFLIVLTAALAYLFAFNLLGDFGVPVERYASRFLGVFLQAAPFLAIGVLLSSAIQVYIPPDWIQRRFPEKVLTGQLFAILAGFCLPVCDCASIPVFKSLVKKGVPLPAAVTFMLVSPVINPVVILSTWYAFNGNYRMIAVRCGLGILCAVICGLTCLIRTPGDYLLEEAVPVQSGCGDYRLPTGNENTRRGPFFHDDPSCAERVLCRGKISSHWYFCINAVSGPHSFCRIGRKWVWPVESPYSDDGAGLYSVPLFILRRGGGKKYGGKSPRRAADRIPGIRTDDGHEECCHAAVRLSV